MFVTEKSSSRQLTDQELVERGPAEAVRILLKSIDPNPNNPRHELVDVDALAENIRVFGLMQPITVRRVHDRYEILGGHRRYAAFQHLREIEPHDVQWRSIPAVVRRADDDRAYLMLISSQVHNRAWRPREEAAALERLALAGLTLKQIGEKLQRTEGWASKRLRVYADPVLSGYVQSGQLNASIAEELLPVGDLDAKKRIAENAVNNGLSQHQIKVLVRALRLDRQLSHIGRLARELATLLSSVDAQDIPMDATRDLLVIMGRVEVISGIKRTRLPTVEQAEVAAGIKHSGKPLPRRGAKRKPGYKPKLG